MNIGIFGAPLNDPNLGCVALCYSTLVMLECIRKDTNLDLHYTIFDYKYDEKKLIEVSDTLNIPTDRISYCRRGNISDPLRIIKHLPGILKMNNGLKKSDVIIDLTEGDSFSDIYGDVIFKGKTNVKLLIENKGIPLIFGPQTIGPFYRVNNQLRASKAINRASLVIARDELSAKCVHELGRKDVLRTIDLAFMLPYKNVNLQRNKKRIGINVSSMLYSEQNEMKVQRFILKANYRKSIEKIISNLIESDEYEIYLIPHVSFDHLANQILKKQFPPVTCIEPQSNPVKIKSIIGSMDFFIGARMHATIAAVSSGIPCVPMSYGRKFTGLYGTINYNHVVDLEKLSTDDVVNTVMEKIQHKDKLKEDIDKSKIKYNIFLNKTIEAIKTELLKIPV